MSSRKLLKKVLNINTVLRDEYQQEKNNPENISNITSVIQNNINHNYQVQEYRGRGVGGDIYLAKDNGRKSSDNRIVCKIINVNKGDVKRILAELGVLSVLANNNNSRKYINPCIDYGFNKKQLFLFFPAFTGHKLKNLKNHLSTMNYNDFSEVVKFIIRNLLNAISTIHKKNIAHQNLDDSSIVISSNLKNKDNMHIKLVDFGLACGIYKVPENKMNELAKQLKSSKLGGISKDTYFKSCLDIPDYFLSKNNEDVVNSSLNNKNIKAELQKIMTQSLRTYKNSDYIKLAQLYDIWCCGKIFYDIIHSRANKGTNASDIDGIDNRLSWYTNINLNKREPSSSLKYYSNIVENMMLVPIKERKSAKYILDKILTHEKYKDM